MAASRSRRTWLIFAVCVAAVLAALGWSTAAMLGLERARRSARAEAELQEKIRVALWRMDSILSPRLVEEAARPYFHYAPFYGPQRAYTNMLLPLSSGEVLVPSPLLTFSDPFFKLHFQVNTAGRTMSPQVPVGNLRDLAEAFYTTPADVAGASARLGQFVKVAGPRVTGANALMAADNLYKQEAANKALRSRAGQLKSLRNDQLAQSAQEWDNRQQAVETSQQRVVEQNLITQNSAIPPDSAGVTVSPFVPIWQSGPGLDRLLFFVRHVGVDKTQLTQGIWADWPAIRKAMRAAVADLLPDATIEPTDAPESCEPGTLLACVPAVLYPGMLRADDGPLLTPLRAVLALAWLVVLVAVATAGVVLAKAVELSRRRGEFVSAVTHELRTPLTTFRMYSEMLSEGMVPDEKARQEYLATLRDESDHLSCLVENVLAYARLEQGGSAGMRRERMTVGDMVGRATGRSAERARRAGCELTITFDSAAPGLDTAAWIASDPAAVEQIVSNLIDNAMKYACPADPRVEVIVSRSGGQLCISVADHGPGIDAKDADRIFRPFVRGGNSNSVVQGVGLGLAIARQLARNLGGDLRLAPKEGNGTAFELILPLDGRV